MTAYSELEDNFGAGFDKLSGAKAVQAVLEEIKDQEESIKIAEASPLGYKLVEAYKDKKLGFRFVKDNAKAIELKKLEQELLKNVEDKGKRGLIKRERSRSRSRSAGRRSRSRSNGRRSDKGKGVGKGSSGSRSQGACVWCGKDGHGYKFCYKFQADCASGNAVYDIEQRKFVRKGEESSSSKRNRSPARRDRSPSKRRTRSPPRRR